MSRVFTPYRHLAALLTVVVLAGTILPANLHAVGAELFCFMDMADRELAADMPCEWNNHDDSSDDLMHHQAESSDCTLHYSCSCSIDNAEVKKEAVIQSSKTKVILPSNEDGIAAGLLPVLCFATISSSNRTASPPPIYLLNSAFLN